jgi:hypothetical protein
MAGYLKVLRKQQQQKHEEKVGSKGKQSKSPYRQQKQKLAFCGAGRTCVACRWLLLIALDPGSICGAYSPRAGGDGKTTTTKQQQKGATKLAGCGDHDDGVQ